MDHDTRFICEVCSASILTLAWIQHRLECYLCGHDPYDRYGHRIGGGSGSGHRC